jgi:metallo-beta-lactamase class B
MQYIGEYLRHPMRKIIIPCFLLFFLAAIASVRASGQQVTEPTTKAEWSADYKPFRIVGNLYYVGTQDLACYLITTGKGNILINTGLAASASLIQQHIEALGFKIKDTKVLLTLQAHYDHVGAMAAMKAQTGATLMVDAKDAGVLTSGGATDYEMGKYGVSFKPVQPDRLLQDGDTVSLGEMKLLMLHHPGHTKGSCSYLFTVKDGRKAYWVLIANMPTIIVDGSLDSIAAYPNIARDYAYTLGAMKGLSFDIWLAAHASQFGLNDKHKPSDAYNPAAFIDPKGYAAALDDLQKQYEKKIKQ